MCLDDFGAGAASFQYLRALDVDYVKIDGTYTRRLLSSERDSLLLRKLCDLCADLKIETIAEMVELEDPVDKLRSLGVKMGQGYLLGRPAPQPVFVGGSGRRRRAYGRSGSDGSGRGETERKSGGVGKGGDA